MPGARRAAACTSRDVPGRRRGCAPPSSMRRSTRRWAPTSLPGGLVHSGRAISLPAEAAARRCCAVEVAPRAPRLTARATSPTLARNMRSMIQRNAQRASRTYRRLAPQILRPRLRPCWRIAIATPVILALLACAAWTASAVGRALAERDIKAIQARVAEVQAEIQAELRAQREREQLEQDKARRTAWSNGYVPGDEQLCELLYHKEVARCDRAALQRLAADAAHKRVEQSPARTPRGAASKAKARR